MMDLTTNTRSIANTDCEKTYTLVTIPKVLQDCLDASDLHGPAKDVIYYLAYRHYAIGKSVGLNQKLLNVSLSHNQRKKIISFIRNCPYISKALNGKFKPDVQSIRYHLTDVPEQFESGSQHNFDTVSSLWCYRLVDFNGLLVLVKKGFEFLEWDLALFNAEWSLGLVDEPVLDDATFVEAFEVEVECESAEKAAEVLESHKAAYDRFREQKTEHILVRDGRTYTSVSNLPRWIRKSQVKFDGGVASADISAAYWFFLAADERLSKIRYGMDTSELDEFISLVNSGSFYKTLATMADIAYETDAEQQEVKKQVQTFCLFGPIGWHPLWRALFEISPHMCRTILWWHAQYRGVSELAYFLQRSEGRVMTHGLVREMCKAGFPAVQIHDGCLVPETMGRAAAEFISQKTAEIYGVACRVSVVERGVKTYV